MLALLDLAAPICARVHDAKRREGGIDYHDLEQFALRLLWKTGGPRAIAEQWRHKLSLIFVDEYQDINEAQEAIIQAVAREGGEANLFLVGDVKQSIYGFRLADPRIFAKYHEAGRPSRRGAGHSADGKFSQPRKHSSISSISIFGGLMRRETGGVDYDAASICFSATPPRGRASGWPMPRPAARRIASALLGSESEKGRREEIDSRPTPKRKPAWSGAVCWN